MTSNMSPDRNGALQLISVSLLVGYALQFLGGMTLNLFVTIPTHHPGAASSNYFIGAVRGLAWTLAGHGGWPLAIHVYLAVTLVIGSAFLALASIRAHVKPLVITSIVAALFTISALFNGISFINYDHDISSMIMASCWLVAVGSLVYGLATSLGINQCDKRLRQP